MRVATNPGQRETLKQSTELLDPEEVVMHKQRDRTDSFDGQAMGADTQLFAGRGRSQPLCAHCHGNTDSEAVHTEWDGYTQRARATQ